ncbi:FAD-dependent monooxygenase [Mesorhizobium sp. ESP7-2]|uniref:FAD-dependent monooxygenase n=1 Tax=unclassified Mesorhizobium TaxID=325217 RepID=UPI001CCD60B5|nr:MULTISPECIES: FAD-dependent monooxygenase [unclassified Mesorhizobium]MBZ9673109.1 FAD-dependent monooxygenase [Mesorhizobium sp. ES1-3]MBZ9709449.1 FAD-dependent monooxygenase [Mesorhizobium sp. ESP7-2]
MTMSKTRVLIAGAGPTGLTLALWLTKLGVPVRIFDKAAAPGETSRALAVQARTLEFHRQIGIVDDVLAAGVKIEQLTVHTPAGVAAKLPLSDFGRGISPYSFAFALPQDIHERVLIAHLEHAGVTVERSTELVAFQDRGDAVVATLSKEGRAETVGAAYLAGCDGAHSAVRHGLRVGFPGGAYEQSFYVADVKGRGEITRNGMDTAVSAYGFAIVMPVRQSGSVRLIGIVPKAHEADETISFEVIRADVERDTGVTVDEVNWFSTYRVHHRVAERFRVGRVFLCGDAGHIHSPAGGQGMNTGMGDAVNLAWKLAAVVQGRADPRLLDSYEPERIAFARKLIESTDQAFRIATSRSRLIGLFRRYLMPKILNIALHTSVGSRAFFGVISQAAIQYRAGPISWGTAGKISGGDRLPYVPTASSDNFEPLRSLDWQVHVYGEINSEFRTMIASTGIPIHAFAWSHIAAKAGLQKDAAYLVRPDGHVALALPMQEAASFQRYLAGLAIRPRTAERAPYRVPGTMHSLA